MSDVQTGTITTKVPARLDRAGLEQYRELVEAEMHRVTEKAERQVAQRYGGRIKNTNVSTVEATQSAA